MNFAETMPSFEEFKVLELSAVNELHEVAFCQLVRMVVPEDFRTFIVIIQAPGMKPTKFEWLL
jgi:hypothetical protein